MATTCLRSRVAVYATVDLPLVRMLDRRLRDDGKSLWIDVDRFRSDRTWEEQRAHALAACEGVVFVYSEFWDYDDGLVRDVSEAISAIASPAGGGLSAVYLDVSAHQISGSLAALPWVKVALGTLPLVGVTEAWDSPHEFSPSDLAWWQSYFGSHDPTLGRLKRALRHRLDESFEWWTDRQWERIDAAWAPFESSPFFDLDHAVWRTAPGLSSRLLVAKCMLFSAAAQLVSTDFGKYLPATVGRLSEVVKVSPFSHDPTGPTSLSAEDVEIVNDCYLTTLEFALEWFTHWTPDNLVTMGTPHADAWELYASVEQRILELRDA